MTARMTIPMVRPVRIAFITKKKRPKFLVKRDSGIM